MDQRTIAERHRLGLDRRDEMWKGVLHVVPPTSERHQSIENELLGGVDGAPVPVVEIRSPGDESYDEVPWYLGRGAEEVLVVDGEPLEL